MSSSEIEVIVSDSQIDNENSTKSSNRNPEGVEILDVYAASAYGDLDKLKKFVEQDGCSLSVADGNGYYALQWAALNNFADVAMYILEHGGEVNATDNSQQTALHWAEIKLIL
ncbi:protein S-acyltransferase [Ranunculus cassubicifolius]